MHIYFIFIVSIISLSIRDTATQHLFFFILFYSSIYYINSQKWQKVLIVSNTMFPLPILLSEIYSIKLKNNNSSTISIINVVYFIYIINKNNISRANIWQGTFPNHNSAKDGYIGTNPVQLFPQNDFGLHNMAGNVWEWTEDSWSCDNVSNIESPIMNH